MCEICACQSSSFLDLNPERVLESLWMLMQSRAMVARRHPCAQYAKGDLGRSKVRLRLLNDAPQRFKCGAMPIHNRADARVERHSAQVPEPGNAHIFETAIKRPCKEF